MYKLKNVLLEYILLILYNSLIYSHLNYGLFVWGIKADRLEILQKKAVRIVTKSNFIAHTDPLFRQLNVLKIKDMFKVKILKFYYKLSYGLLPKYFNSYILIHTVGIIKKMQRIFPTEILLAIYNALVLPHINYCILSWGADSNTIFILQKKAVRAIASAGYNAHTEPFFKLYNLLKIEDIYKFRLLVLYHNISHLKTPQYLDIFLPNTSQGNIHYAMRNPRLQLPVHFHEFIKTTCRYQLPTLLNNLNSESEILKHVIANIETTTLLGLKRIMKNYFLDKYSYFCHIPDCYIWGLT